MDRDILMTYAMSPTFMILAPEHQNFKNQIAEKLTRVLKTSKPNFNTNTTNTTNKFNGHLFHCKKVYIKEIGILLVYCIVVFQLKYLN